MASNSESYQVLPFPKIRRLMVDGGRLARQRHIIHGLVEMDVTRARQIIREHKARSGETLSFTAFFAACLGRAVDQDRHLHAMRTWGERLVLFDEVDVNTLFEVEAGGHRIIRPHTIRAANHKAFRDIHAEIRAFQAGHQGSPEARWIGWFVRLPGFLRRLVLGVVLNNPHWRKELNGTVSLTAVGMFGSGGGWGIPASSHTLQVTLGGIAEKPVLVGGQLENREFLCVTVSLDHDLVDGAPAARFTQRLKELVERGEGLE